MSRHGVIHKGHEVVVGWDPPLRTFFGQVFRIPEDDDGAIVWVGATPGVRILSVPDLQRDLGQWGDVIDSEMASRLERDREENIA